MALAIEIFSKCISEIDLEHPGLRLADRLLKELSLRIGVYTGPLSIEYIR
jgi:hypothetical protein